MTRVREQPQHAPQRQRAAEPSRGRRHSPTTSPTPRNLTQHPSNTIQTHKDRAQQQSTAQVILVIQPGREALAYMARPLTPRCARKSQQNRLYFWLQYLWRHYNVVIPAFD